jgi:outer membrane immunogenic protein
MISLTAFAAATAFASPAMAQDNTAPAGFRVEALVGYDHAGAFGQHGDGVLFGVGAGYDFAVNPTISLGVDAEASDSTTKDSGISAARDLYAGGRINFAVSPRANLYIKGGYTNARLKGFGGSANLDGFRVGAGGQVIVAGKTYVGAEYRYSNYESDFSRHQVALTVGTRF